MIRNENNRLLMIALNKLNDRERNIIALKYAAELNHKQIAQLMKLSVANVGIILFRSLKKLKKTLSEESKEKSLCQILKRTGKHT